MKKVLLVAMLVAFGSAAIVTTYSTAYAGGGPKPTQCKTTDIGDDNCQGDEDGQ